MYKFKLNKGLCALLGVLLPPLVTGAQFSSTDLNKLQDEIERKGVTAVMVTLDSSTALTDIKHHLAHVNIEMKLKANRLLAELGLLSEPVGYWDNGIGQIGFYIDAAGLENLVKSDEAESFQSDTTRASRVLVHSADGSLELVEQEILEKGFSNTEIYLNLDEVNYDIGKDEVVYYGGAELSRKAQQSMDKLLSKLSKGKLLNSKVQENSPSFKAKIDLEAFYNLRESKDVRAIRPIGFKDQRKSFFDPDTLRFAQNNVEKRASVVISLRGGSLFSPKTGYMPERAVMAQKKANKSALQEILTEAGADISAIDFDTHSTLGFVQANLSLTTLSNLYKNADNRILKVDLNKPFFSLMLNESTSLINMQAAWNAGYTAAGQNIIVIDSGVRPDHAMLKDRVTFEACFGSNAVDQQGFIWRSICPSAGQNGDSPLGLAGSAAPHANLQECLAMDPVTNSRCAHGTHVAGIAAGRNSNSLSLQGVAPDANIIAVQVTSIGTNTSGAVRDTIFTADLEGALNAVVNNTNPAATDSPFVVNLSLGGGLFTGDCDINFPALSNAIQMLNSRSIPVVAAAGNHGANGDGIDGINDGVDSRNRMEISSPACISNTIKVAAVLDDGINYAGFSNLGAPGNFTGPILLAPGVNITSALYTATTGTVELNGTSQATPHVAGLYAAIKAGVPGISVADATAWIIGSGSFGVTYSFPQPFGPQAFRRINIPNF